jgi:uncharacterized protein (TIGR02271 family)
MSSPRPARSDDAAPPQTIPVVSEELEVTKNEVVTGLVRVTLRTHEREVLLEESLHDEEVDIERCTLERPVEGPLEPRHEGATLVIPVVEEVLEVRKRYVLKEEIRIRRRSVQRPHRETVVLREEEAVVERVDPRARPQGGHQGDENG